MPDPIRIRAQAAGDHAVVRVLIRHEMESGQRQDAMGRRVAAHFVREVRATHNGLTLFTAEWGPWVARDPILSFEVKAARVGDRIGICWRDDQGQSRSDETTVVP
ncbi:thiosulfate oxidation carrier complex protein SoxZ [Malikia sp.]|uniref:thiosulfate oxidation carrier complex protein SoxZ n=1 Tax=Malikia sp. TaxID=2070706 RepID=UPI0026332A53|nr:thiosulfate oxidation carrier complex protein SoxZ [Malikia sp.]MDD2728052.1 thiosulfate oxidation carrier complex protein SoxZ [Malikia sp.]